MAEIQYAKDVFETIEKAKAEGKGVVSLRGKMIDAPIVARAQQVLEAAEAMGLYIRPAVGAGTEALAGSESLAGADALAGPEGSAGADTLTGSEGLAGADALAGSNGSAGADTLAGPESLAGADALMDSENEVVKGGSVK